MKLLLLDKDGTLVKPKSGNQFVQSPKDQELLPGVEEAIAAYAVDGWQMAIVSNQGGVEAGHKTLDSAIAEMEFCMKLIPQIKSVYFCPNFSGDTCFRTCLEISDIDGWSSLKGGMSRFFRKPDAGMIYQAVDDLMSTVDYSAIPKSLLIGDRDEDRDAATAAGIPFLAAAEWWGETAIR